MNVRRDLVAATVALLVALASSTAAADTGAGASTTAPAATTTGDAATPPTDGDVVEPPITGRVSVIVPTFRAVGGDVTVSEVETLTGVAVFNLGQVPHLRVISGADIREMLEHAANQQLVGCTDDACLSEIADALGAPLLVAGEVARLGPRLRVMMSLMDTTKAVVVARAVAEGRDLADVARKLRHAIAALTVRYGGVPGVDADDEDEGLTMVRFLVERVSDPDVPLLLLLVMSSLATLLFPPAVFFIPIVHAAMLWLLDESFAGRHYPWWWLAIPAGYGAFIVAGIAAAVGGFVVFTSTPAGTDIQTFSTTFTSSGIMFATLFVVEPMVAWWCGTLAARDMDLAPLVAPREDAPESPVDESAGEAPPVDGDAAPAEDEAEPAAARPESLLADAVTSGVGR